MDIRSEQTKIAAIELRDKLSYAFMWNFTIDGFDYWNDVAARLSRIGKDGY